MTQAEDRDRPQGETSGSSQRPSHHLAKPTLAFDLAGEYGALQEEPSWQRGDRNARTLVEEPGLRVVLTALKTGARLHEHHTPGWVSIQAMVGHLRVHAGQQTIDLRAGHLVTLEPDVPHEVEAVEESSFLLTVAGLQRGGA